MNHVCYMAVSHTTADVEGISDGHAPENKLKQATLLQHCSSTSAKWRERGGGVHHVRYHYQCIGYGKHLLSICQIKTKLINTNGRLVLSQDAESS